ncbi:MAG: hypothetical protein KGM17_08755 [Sphingomonadales bacterium]|nr:hypothetical protein [Sphingomonadales bacterium]
MLSRPLPNPAHVLRGAACGAALALVAVPAIAQGHDAEVPMRPADAPDATPDHARPQQPVAPVADRERRLGLHKSKRQCAVYVLHATCTLTMDFAVLTGATGRAEG